MITTRYVIRIEALGPHGETIADFNQIVEQEVLSKSRPRILITFIERFVRTFLVGHAKAEKKLAAARKRNRPKVGMSSLMPKELSHADHV